MYGRGTKIFFGFMAVTMVIGYPLVLLSSLPTFQNLLTGSTTGNGAQVKIVEKSREVVLDENCTVKSKPKAARLKRCKDALNEMGLAYQALATPDQPKPGEEPVEPENSQEYLDKSLESFQLLVALDPKDRESRQLLAGAYSNQQKFAQAVPLYKSLVKQDPDPDLVFALAISQQNAGENDAAIATYKRFIKLAPTDSRADTAKEAIKGLKEQAASGGGLGGAGGLDISGLGGGLNIG